jgi:hypothetical protein
MVSSLLSASPLLGSMVKLPWATLLGVHCVSAALWPSAAGNYIFPAAFPGLGRQLTMQGSHNAVQMDWLKDWRRHHGNLWEGKNSPQSFSAAKASSRKHQVYSSMCWLSVRWGKNRYPEDVLNRDFIPMFRVLSVHSNYSVLGKWEKTTCESPFPFLWGWWSDNNMTGKTWLQNGHNLCVCPSCWTPCSHLSAQPGPTTPHGPLSVWDVQQEMCTPICKGPKPQVGSGPSGDPRGSGYSEKRTCLQEQPLTGNAFPKLSLDTGPKYRQESVPNCPRFILSMDMVLP